MAVFAPQAADTMWVDYMFLGGTFGSRSTRPDIFEVHAGGGVNDKFPIGIGVGGSVFRAVGATRQTGLSVFVVVSVDVVVVTALSENRENVVPLSARAFGTCCLCGFSMNKVAAFTSGRLQGAGARWTGHGSPNPSSG